jgi:hypothetical protein
MPREKPGLIAGALSREERAASAASEGSLAYGFFQPITVAGPRPIFTAFPAAHACKLKIECMSRIAVCQRVNKLPPKNLSRLCFSNLNSSQAIAQRFFQLGLRFSTSARSPSCESSSRYNSFRKIFMEFFKPSFSDIPIPPRIAFLAIVNTGPEWPLMR